MRTLSIAAALALGAVFAAPVSAEPASKHAFAYREPTLISDAGTSTLLSQNIKTANEKGLAVTVSLECELIINSVTKSKGLAKTDNKASVKVSVLVDGHPAAPGPVTFCSRHTKTSAAFAGIFTRPENTSCFYLEDIDTSVPPDGIFDDQIIKVDPECLSPEELELYEDSMSAHSYVFYYDATAPGDHTVTVVAEIDEQTGADGEDTLAEDQNAQAVIGNGSMLVEEIRLVHGATGESL